MRKRFPRAAGHITSAKLAGELIEIFPRFVLTFVQNELQTRAITRGLRQFARQQAGYFRGTFSLRALSIVVCPIVNIFPDPAVRYDAGALQLCEMTRDAGLAHAQNLL